MTSFFLTDRSIRSLDADAGASLNSISSRLQARTIGVGGSIVAWGQYLDERFTGAQWGLLGTSAASQALALTDDGATPYQIREDGVTRATDVGLARAVLPRDRSAIDPALMKRQLEGREFFNIIRLASVAEALDLDRPVVGRDDWPPVVEDIVNSRGAHPWWSSESAAERPPTSQAPSVFVTAFVTYALRRYEDAGQLLNNRVWLSSQLSDAQLERRLDLTALIGLALIGAGRQTDTRVLDGIDTCRERIVRRRGGEKNPTVDRPVFVGYTVENRTDYAFLNPEHLSALFLLSAGNPAGGRRFVLRTVQATTSRVRSGGGFETELGGEATVEQLWTTRLLDAYLTRTRDPNLRETLRPGWFVTRTASVLLLLALVAVCSAVGFFLSDDSIGAAVSIAAGGLLGIGGLFVAAPGRT